MGHDPPSRPPPVVVGGGGLARAPGDSMRRGREELWRQQSSSGRKEAINRVACADGTRLVSAPSFCFPGVGGSFGVRRSPVQASLPFRAHDWAAGLQGVGPTAASHRSRGTEPGGGGGERAREGGRPTVPRDTLRLSPCHSLYFLFSAAVYRLLVCL